MTESNKLTKWFKAIAIIALLWNIMGVMSYLMHAYMSEETLATLPKNQQDFMNNLPAWRMASFAIATFGALIASILLLMKKKMALTLFTLSFIAIIAGNIYDIFMANYYKDAEITGLILPLTIFLISLFLIWFTKKLTQQNFLN